MIPFPGWAGIRSGSAFPIAGCGRGGGRRPRGGRIGFCSPAAAPDGVGEFAGAGGVALAGRSEPGRPATGGAGDAPDLDPAFGQGAEDPRACAAGKNPGRQTHAAPEAAEGDGVVHDMQTSSCGPDRQDRNRPAAAVRFVCHAGFRPGFCEIPGSREPEASLPAAGG